MHEKHLRMLGLIYSTYVQFAELDEEYRNLKKQKIQDTFIKTVVCNRLIGHIYTHIHFNHFKKHTRKIYTFFYVIQNTA